MAEKKHPQVRRQEATQATIDRFVGSTLAWSTNDCGRLIAFHLRKMGNKAPMPKAGSYRDAKGSLRALKEATGHTRMQDALEQHVGLVRITYAEARLGDLVAMPSADGEDWPAMFVALDNDRVLGFLSDGERMECRVATPLIDRVQGAWRVEPK